MKHYWADVPRLGNVAVSRHAQSKAEKEGLTEEVFEDILKNGKDTPDGQHTIWREKRGFRLVIITPTPFQGALLVKTLYRMKASWKAH